MISESKNDSCLMELVFLEGVGRKLKRRKLKAETIWGEEISLDEVSGKASLGRGTVKGSLREADIRWPWNWGTKTQSKNTCRDICGQGMVYSRNYPKAAMVGKRWGRESMHKAGDEAAARLHDGFHLRKPLRGAWNGTGFGSRQRWLCRGYAFIWEID